MQRSESNSKRPQTWTRYGVAILAVVAAAGLRLLLDPVLGENLPFPTFFAAILIAVWFGGFGPGLLALVLGFFAADFLFVNVRSRNERRPLSLV